MSESISIGFVIRNSATGEMLAETPDGPSSFMRTSFSPSIFLSKGEVLLMMGRLGAHMDSIWSCHNVTTSPDQRERYVKEHNEWHIFLENADVVELRAMVR